MGFKSARKKAGKSMLDVVKALDVSAASVYCWENGTYKPRASLLPKIAELYGCTIEELLSEDEQCKS